MTNHVMLVSIQAIKSESAEKDLVDKLVDECTENVEEVKIELHSSGNENVCLCPYAISVILAVRALAISIGIGAYFAFSCWY